MCDSSHRGGMEMAAAKGTGLLSPEQIEEFQRRGVLVISNFLSADEVYDARKGEYSFWHKGGGTNNQQQSSNLRNCCRLPRVPSKSRD